MLGPRSDHLPLLIKCWGNEEIIELPTASKLRPEPSRQPPAPRPGLRRVLRIAILGTNRRVRAALTINARGFVNHSDLAQPLLQSGFFCQYFPFEFGRHLFVELPKLVNGERIQMISIHSAIRFLEALNQQSPGGRDKSPFKERPHNPHLIVAASSEKGARVTIL